MIFDTPPDDFRPKIHVVTCYVECENKILYLLRHKKESNGTLWGLPGGKIEPQETPLAALVRELREETGIITAESTIQPRSLFYVRYPTMDFTYRTYHLQLATFPSVTLDGKEHDAYCWVTPQEALLLDHVPDGKPALQKDYSLRIPIVSYQHPSYPRHFSFTLVFIRFCFCSLLHIDESTPKPL